MADFLSLYGHNIGSTSGGGGTGGGHEIVNASGTSLPQEDKLQFTGGLKATDDSTNGKTVVDDSATEITFTQWNNMTPEQQAAIPKAIITEVPSVDGGIQADLMTKLWENPNPTASFAAQDIDLSSDDYDFLYINTSNGSSMIVEKGQNIRLNEAATTTSSSYINVDFRRLTYTNDKKYAAEDAYRQASNAQRTVNNAICIPLAIYGIKKTINLEFSAIASNVGTLASNCIADDEVTSMQDVTDSIAPTDTTPATAAHAIGEQFYFNGQLVTATSAIAIGDAIAVGTNCSASDTVTEQIGRLYAVVTNITFTNGVGTFALNGVNTSSTVIVERNTGTVHDMVLSASCTANLITISAYRTVSQTAFSGTISVNILVYI